MIPRQGVRLDTVQRAVTDIAAGRPVVVIDDESRENEGDLIMAGTLATAGSIAFMVRYTSGFLCVAMSEARADRLDLPPMYRRNDDPFGTAYAVTVDASAGITTGISAHDRARTITTLSDPATTGSDLHRPGHTVPLRAKAGGVLRRAGHTEAAVDVCTLAGLEPVGVLCEIVSEADPTQMARAGELRVFADRHQLAMISIADLIAFRLRTEALVQQVGEARLPLRQGNFTAIGYRSGLDAREHVALVHGEVGDGEDVMVRVQPECIIGHAFGSLRCACSSQLAQSLQLIVEQGRGVLVYLRTPIESENGLLDTLVEYARLDALGIGGADGPCRPMDPRDYGIGAQILTDLGVRSVNVLSESGTTTRVGLKSHGLVVHRSTALHRAPVELGSFWDSEDLAPAAGQ